VKKTFVLAGISNEDSVVTFSIEWAGFWNNK
jgi:tRNA splicing endonuclease